MAQDVILGTDLMLFKGGKALAVATSCKLTINANVLETSSKDSGCWVSKQAAKLSWNASSDNLFTVADYKSLVDAMISRDEVELQFSTVANANDCNGVPTSGWTPATDGYKGSAIITSIDMNASDNENATYTVSFEGVGALTPVTA
jgi:predicted secreted protein